MCSGASFDVFLEGLSNYTMPQDIQAMINYTAQYGIYYPTLPPPTVHETRQLVSA